MFHFFKYVSDSKGNALPGWQIEVVELDTTNVVDIYSDENETPIETVSGVTNRAVADVAGNAEGFVLDGTYGLRFYDAAGVFQRAERYLPMYGNAELTLATAVTDATAQAALAEASATEAAGSAIAAAASAATLNAEITAYDDAAAGIAGVADGEQFDTEQDYGGYHFRWTRSGTAANFEEPVARNTSAVTWDAKIEAEKQAYITAGVPQDGIRIITATGRQWGGRQMANIWAADDPTLNVVHPLYPRDEEGNTTPTRTISTNTDPLGNLEAVNLNFTSGTHNLEQLNNADDDGLIDDYTFTASFYQRHDSDTEETGFGSPARTAGNYFQAAATSSWAQVSGTGSTVYNSTTTYDLGLVPNSGAATPYDVEVYGIFLALEKGTGSNVTIPSLAELKAEHDAGHAKPASARPGVLTIDDSGFCVGGNAYYDNCLISIGRMEINDYTMDVIVDLSSEDYTTTSYVAALSFANVPDGSTSANHNEGAIGMDMSTGDEGLLYVQPQISSISGLAPRLRGQGPIDIAVNVTRDSGTSCTVETFMGGALVLQTTETIATGLEVEYLNFMGEQLGRSRRQDGDRRFDYSDRAKNPGFVTRSRSDSEMGAVADATASILGPLVEPPIYIIGSFDSTTAFADSPFNQLTAADSLHPGLIPIVEAIGGSRYGSGSSSDYIDAGRQGLRRRMLETAARAAYNRGGKVVWQCYFGINDLVSGVMDPVDEDWQTGAELIDTMIFADIASVTSTYRDSILPVVTSISPYGQWAASDADATDDLREAARLAYNAWRAANFESQGYSAYLNWEDYVPSGFSTLLEAAIDAYDTTSDNGVFQSTSPHWSSGSNGGLGACNAVLVPYLETLRTSIRA